MKVRLKQLFMNTELFLVRNILYFGSVYNLITKRKNMAKINIDCIHIITIQKINYLHKILKIEFEYLI